MEKITQIIQMIKNINIENLKDLGLALAIVIILKLLSPVFAFIIIKLVKFKEKDNKRIKQSSFYKPLKDFFLIIGVYIGFNILDIPQNIMEVISKLFRICIIILVANGFANLCDTSSNANKRIREKLNFQGNDTVVKFVGKAIKIIIYIIAGFVIISELDYDINGLATGLGLGSVVIALAAQDIAKNILGGMSIITDKTFEIGDYIETTTSAGTVEDITFRTTRIRDVNNQIVIIPNSMIADSLIINRE